MTTSDLRLRYSSSARADVRSILRQTERNWGVVERQSFETNLEKLLENIRRFPEIGVPKPELGPSVRIGVLGVYIVYYTVQTSAVVVLRLQHYRMTPALGQV